MSKHIHVHVHDARFNSSEHPRAQSGEFTSSGGEEKKKRLPNIQTLHKNTGWVMSSTPAMNQSTYFRNSKHPGYELEHEANVQHTWIMRKGNKVLKRGTRPELHEYLPGFKG